MEKVTQDGDHAMGGREVEITMTLNMWHIFEVTLMTRNM
jgi:hypothetical protein